MTSSSNVCYADALRLDHCLVLSFDSDLDLGLDTIRYWLHVLYSCWLLVPRMWCTSGSWRAAHRCRSTTCLAISTCWSSITTRRWCLRRTVRHWGKSVAHPCRTRSADQRDANRLHRSDGEQCRPRLDRNRKYGIVAISSFIWRIDMGFVVYFLIYYSYLQQTAYTKTNSRNKL